MIRTRTSKRPHELRSRFLAGVALAAGALAAGFPMLTAGASTIAPTASISLASFTRPLAANPTTDLAYVAQGDSVAVVSSATAAIEKTISIGEPILGLAVDSANNTLYVLQYTESKVLALNPTTGAIVATVTAGLRTTGDCALEFDQTAGIVFLVTRETGKIVEISTSDDAVLRTLTLGPTKIGSAAAVSGPADTLFLGGYTAGVTAVDSTTGAVLWTTTSPSTVSNISVDAQTGQLWVSTTTSPNLTVLDESTGAVEASVEVGGAALPTTIPATLTSAAIIQRASDGATLAPSTTGKYVYASTWSGAVVQAISTASDTVVGESVHNFTVNATYKNTPRCQWTPSPTCPTRAFEGAALPTHASLAVGGPSSSSSELFVEDDADRVSSLDVLQLQKLVVGPPAAPAQSSPTTVAVGSATLHWVAPTTDGGSSVTGFNVFEGGTPGGEAAAPVNSNPLPATASSFVVSGLSPSSSYYFEVQAINEAGSSASSNEEEVTTASPPPPPPPPTPPTPPAQTTPTTVGVGSATVHWVAPTDDGGSPVIGFNVYEGGTPGGEASTPVNSSRLPATASSFVASGLSAGTTYFFEIQAINAAGSSPSSNEEEVTTASPPPPPLFVANAPTIGGVQVLSPKGGVLELQGKNMSTAIAALVGPNEAKILSAPTIGQTELVVWVHPLPPGPEPLTVVFQTNVLQVPLQVERNAPIETTCSAGPGTWSVTPEGVVTPSEGASSFGTLHDELIPAPIVGIAATPGCDGYWLVASNGAVYPFGAARSYGHLSFGIGQVAGLVPSADGNGYWLVMRNGAAYPAGDASPAPPSRFSLQI